MSEITASAVAIAPIPAQARNEVTAMKSDRSRSDTSSSLPVAAL